MGAESGGGEGGTRIPEWDQRELFLGEMGAVEGEERAAAAAAPASSCSLSAIAWGRGVGVDVVVGSYRVVQYRQISYRIV